MLPISSHLNDFGEYSTKFQLQREKKSTLALLLNLKEIYLLQNKKKKRCYKEKTERLMQF